MSVYALAGINPFSIISASLNDARSRGPGTSNSASSKGFPRVATMKNHVHGFVKAVSIAPQFSVGTSRQTAVNGHGSLKC